MRTFFIILGLLLIAVIGYAYDKDSAGCAKLGTDLVAIFHDLTSSAPATDQTAMPPSAPKAAAVVPATTSTPAPVPVSAVPVSPPVKAWVPPAVLPAQPNWSWTTQDGTTYQNVVVTSIDPETVTITHSMGVAHLPLSTLPPDIQKQLNYDPAAAAAAREERQREIDHPYYTMASLNDAQDAARRLHWPLAWMCGHLLALSTPNPQTGSEEDVTQMALSDLKPRAIVIFLDGNADLPALSPIIRDQQFFILDEGPIPGGHHFYAPKIVFSDPDITKTYGRVTFTQMKSEGKFAIDSVLAAMLKDSVATPATNAPQPVPASPSPTPATTPTAPTPTAPSSPNPAP